MCGRFTLRASKKTLAEWFRAPEPAAELLPRFNIAPSQPVAVVRPIPGQKERELVSLRWGLIPPWAENAAIGNRFINARAESAADKPAFRSAFRQRRCLVLADGFFEWKKVEGKKQPYFIRMTNEAPFAFAGLWDQWNDPEKNTIESCTIITTDANELVRPLHDRMPVILDPKGYDRWLDPQVEDPQSLKTLLQPFPTAEMTAYPVNPLVNSARVDDPKCIEPVSPHPAKTLF